MQLSENLTRPRVLVPNDIAAFAPASPNAVPTRSPASDEIDAYIAVRDSFLAEVEKMPTVNNLNRAVAANDLVASCLQPARSPYQAQSLSEAQAIVERKHCETAKVRLAALRAQLSLQMDHACAA
jgi:hypothetical protein